MENQRNDYYYSSTKKEEIETLKENIKGTIFSKVHLIEDGQFTMEADFNEGRATIRAYPSEDLMTIEYEGGDKEAWVRSNLDWNIIEWH